jgi:hypothetical protein
MAWVGAAVATAMILVVLVDTFEVMILPRRVLHGYRLARLYYRPAWAIWRAAAHLFTANRWRLGFLSVFGPLSLFGLLSVWATGLIIGFALLYWSTGVAVTGPEPTFLSYLYFSGSTFFTLGFGDLAPTGPFGRTLCVVEAGLGFTFLAMVLSYLPVLYQAFSRREITIALLDARAGSPPTAGELLRRLAAERNLAVAGALLAEWERWSAELLESHMSYPVLRFYRSQHDRQSWVGTLTVILDTTALLIAGGDGPHKYQAKLTFAVARHAAVDLAMLFQVPPRPQADRLPGPEFSRLFDTLSSAGLPLRDPAAIAKTLSVLRGLYEPFVIALSQLLELELPPFQPDTPPRLDYWQTSPWMAPAPGIDGLPAAGAEDYHFG